MGSMGSNVSVLPHLGRQLGVHAQKCPLVEKYATRQDRSMKVLIGMGLCEIEGLLA